MVIPVTDRVAFSLLDVGYWMLSILYWYYMYQSVLQVVVVHPFVVREVLAISVGLGTVMGGVSDLELTVPVVVAVVLLVCFPSTV